jgi:tetratricopeptide (TPR) repeat protein
MKKNINILYLLLFFYVISISAQETKNIKSLLLSGEYQKVINVLETKISNQDSLSFSEYNSLGVAYQSLMNFNKALPMFYKAYHLQPENIRNLILIGNCSSSLGRNNLAKINYNKVLELDSTNRTAMISLGKILIELEEYNSASELYKKIILSDSTNSYFYSQLGICELKNGNKNFATKFLQKSVKLNTSNAKTILRLASHAEAKKAPLKSKSVEDEILDGT